MLFTLLFWNYHLYFPASCVFKIVLSISSHVTKNIDETLFKLIFISKFLLGSLSYFKIYIHSFEMFQKHRLLEILKLDSETKIYCSLNVSAIIISLPIKWIIMFFFKNKNSFKCFHFTLLWWSNSLFKF
jgi:hypothetical protein